ncbi:hypothetical protein HK100_004917, partial [Physocladia obscura]
MGPNISRTVKANSQMDHKVDSVSTPIISSNESSDFEDATIHLATSLSDSDLTREYHGIEDSEYFLPSDIDEQDRLELQ